MIIKVALTISTLVLVVRCVIATPRGASRDGPAEASHTGALAVGNSHVRLLVRVQERGVYAEGNLSPLYGYLYIVVVTNCSQLVWWTLSLDWVGVCEPCAWY